MNLPWIEPCKRSNVPLSSFLFSSCAKCAAKISSHHLSSLLSSRFYHSFRVCEPSSQIRIISVNYCYASSHSRAFSIIYRGQLLFLLFFFCLFVFARRQVQWRRDREKKAACRERCRRLLSKNILFLFFFFLTLNIHTRREKKIPTTLSALMINIVNSSSLSHYILALLLLLLFTIIICSIQIAIIYMYNARAASVLCGLHCDDGDYSSSGDRYLFIGACVPRERYVIVVVVIVARISVSIERAEISLSPSLSFSCQPTRED